MSPQNFGWSSQQLWIQGLGFSYWLYYSVFPFLYSSCLNFTVQSNKEIFRLLSQVEFYFVDWQLNEYVAWFNKQHIDNRPLQIYLRKYLIQESKVLPGPASSPVPSFRIFIKFEKLGVKIEKWVPEAKIEDEIRFSFCVFTFFRVWPQFWNLFFSRAVDFFLFLGILTK
jgi:hypothetical protein